MRDGADRGEPRRLAKPFGLAGLRIGWLATRDAALLDGFFDRRADGLEWVRPRSWPIGHPRLLGDVPVDDFAARLVERTGVTIVPQSIFGGDGNHFRIGFGRRDMPDAPARLEEFLDA